MRFQVTDYRKHVDELEGWLLPYAKRSFEAFSPEFIGGGDILGHYTDLWNTDKQKLLYRTPAQLERDRILYSDGMRKENEKYHVLYNGRRRVVRDYSSHTMRQQQVVRSICRALGLSSDFAEAMAIGSKTGAVPFIHAAKDAISGWIRDKVEEVDTAFAQHEPAAAGTPPWRQLSLDFEEGREASLPDWVKNLRSPSVFSRVMKFIPWAAAADQDRAYSSGKESYWLLCTNPFTCGGRSGKYMPETMYGVWRHSIGMQPLINSFFHSWSASHRDEIVYRIKWEHATYEGMAVQFADDITWVIENLNDANTAAQLNGKPSVYDALLSDIGLTVPVPILQALHHNDSGAIYTYFISDFVLHSDSVLHALGTAGCSQRAALREGAPESFIGLSEEASSVLEAMTTFLIREIFSEPRVRNRTEMLRIVSRACVDLLYESRDDVLLQVLSDKSAIERWPARDDSIAKAKEIMKDPIHKIQLAVDVLAGMGDKEIYDFVGVEAL